MFNRTFTDDSISRYDLSKFYKAKGIRKKVVKTIKCNPEKYPLELRQQHL